MADAKTTRSNVLSSTSIDFIFNCRTYDDNIVPNIRKAKLCYSGGVITSTVFLILDKPRAHTCRTYFQAYFRTLFELILHPHIRPILEYWYM